MLTPTKTARAATSGVVLLLLLSVFLAPAASATQPASKA